MFDAQTYTDRRNKLRQKLDNGLILFPGNTEASINFPDNWYRFRQDSSFLYFAGHPKPNLSLLMDLDSDESWLVGRELTIEDIIWSGNQPALAELAASSGIKNTMSPEDMKEKILTAVKNDRKVHLLPPYRAEQQVRLAGIFDMEWDSIAHYYVSEPLIRAVVDLRNVKSEEEIEELHRATNITGKMHLGAMRYARPGMMESEVTGYVNGLAVSGGGDLSFPIILSKNGQILHNHYHGNQINKGDLLLVDCGAETAGGYAGDMTRTFPVDKKFTSKQRSIYEIVLGAEELAISMLKPGIPYRDVHIAAVSLIAEGLKSLNILKGEVDDIVESGSHALFMPHGLGHMIGLDVHDMEDLGEDIVGYTEDIVRNPQFGLRSLRLGRELQPGYALTVEPGIYFIPDLIAQWKEGGEHSAHINFSELENWLDFGGIRIEEDYYITESGGELLGDPVAKSIEDVEEIREEALS